MGQAKSRGSLEQRIAQAREQAASHTDSFSLTPRAASIEMDYVLKLCAEVDAASAPKYVPCKPAIGAPPSECFPLVAGKVAEAGGQFVLGWAIWELPGILVEAELHAVWQTPEGQLIDISPRPINFAAITFLPDSKGLSYERQVDNVRHPLSADPKVLRLIELYSEQFALLNEGDLADKFGAITLPPLSMQRYDAIQRELMGIQLYLMRESSLQKPKPKT